MTVSSATNKSGPYTGNGVTTVFAYGFRILDASHIKVVRTEAGVDTVLTTGFTVSGVGNAVGGNVTFAVAPTAAQKITLIRNAPFTQQTDLENQGAYYAETVEEAFDLAAMRDQQLQEQIDRSVKIPVGQDTGVLDTLIEDVIRLTDSVDAIDAVAAIEAQVVTVAGIAADVSVVADNLADVTNFADVYQGPKAVAPTLRNDGTALQAGDLYFDTVIGGMRVRNASAAWVAALSADALEKALNLSDLPNKETARSNLLIPGVGFETVSVLTDANTITRGGLHYIINTATGRPIDDNCMIMHMPSTLTTFASQVAVALATGRMFVRVELSGVWQAWREIAAVSQISGRNRIINGQGRINQRGYVSGTATTGANQYTLDRWRVVVSGQNLTFTGNDAGRTMTAPAGGVEQVIEGANIEGGTYVLNWTGTATATVNGTARAKGETFTLPANTNATVRFTGGTFTDVQLEPGSVPTTFERLPLSDELARCQRYYEAGAYQFGSAAVDASGVSYSHVPFKVSKRNAAYSINRTDTILTNSSASVVAVDTSNGFDISASAVAVGSLQRVRGYWTVDNEL